MAMTPEEIDARRLELLEAAALRETEAHNAVLAERAALVTIRDRQVRALELQAENNRRIADASAWSNRVAVVLDAAIRRIDDRTSTTGAPNIPKAVGEVLATMAEIERQLAPAVPSDPPGLT